MDTVGKATQEGPRPGGPGADARPGKSGEGARSALEQLIQEERRRDAQVPRDDGRGVPPTPPQRA